MLSSSVGHYLEFNFFLKEKTLFWRLKIKQNHHNIGSNVETKNRDKDSGVTTPWRFNSLFKRIKWVQWKLLITPPSWGLLLLFGHQTLMKIHYIHVKQMMLSWVFPSGWKLQCGVCVELADKAKTHTHTLSLHTGSWQSEGTDRTGNKT